MKEKVLQNGKKMKINRWLLLGLAVVLLGGAGLGWYFFSSQATQTAAGSTESVGLAAATRGDLVISATGSGTLTAGRTAELAFPVSGTVAEVNVQVGDRVEAGQELARLADLKSLQLKVTGAQLDLQSAAQALEDLQKNAGSALAEAQLAVVEAQEAYDDARSGLKNKNLVRCDEDETEALLETYQKILNQYEKADDGNHSPDYTLTTLDPLKEDLDEAYAAYIYCAGYTDYEIKTSEAELLKTENALQVAQEELETIAANSGVDPYELAAAQNALQSAELALKEAQENLEGATLKAPFGGTVTGVEGAAGDKAGTSTFITLADLAQPDVEFYIDESDLALLAVGNDVEVTFDALPGETFSGKVTRVEPSLVTVSNYQALKGAARLELSEAQQALTLPEGLSATVEVIGSKAQDAVLVPLEALRDLGGGEYAVFVQGRDGSLSLRTVSVGLKDLANAQILDGLKAGEIVSTGTAEAE